LSGLLLGILLASGVGQAGPQDLQDQANQAYVDGDFTQAAQLWSSLIEAGHPTGDLYYNLGNALFRDGQQARAMLAWRRAQDLSPRDGDITANLDRARRQVQDRLDVDRGPGLFFWQATLSTAEQGWLAAWGCGLVALLAIVGRVRRDVAVGLPAALVGGPALLLVASTASALSAPPGGVVLAETVEVRSAGGERSGVVLFALHAGAEVTLGDSLGSWRLVALPDGRKGWVPQGAVGVVDAASPIPPPAPREGRSAETG